jgi:hypothetical protein
MCVSPCLSVTQFHVLYSSQHDFVCACVLSLVSLLFVYIAMTLVGVVAVETGLRPPHFHCCSHCNSRARPDDYDIQSFAR